MPAQAIRLVGDPILKKPAEHVTDFDKHLVRVVGNLNDTLDRSQGFGVAAPQIGLSKRLFVFLDDQGRKRAIVNPTVTETDGEWEMREGCLSFPNIFFDIVRPRAVCVVGHNISGKDIEIEASDLTARILLHEIDHLDGTLFISLLSPEQRATLTDKRDPNVRAIRKGLRTELGDT